MMPALWADQVSKSLETHASLLSSTPPDLSSEAEEVLDLVGSSIAALCYKPGTTYRSLGRPKLSSSAGWVKIYDEDARRIRTMAGTRQAQYERLGGRNAQELSSMTYSPTSGVVEFRDVPYQFNWQDWDFHPEVSVVALQEPFKIRTISIADGPATAAGTPLQKTWHRKMRKLNCFGLIGGIPVSEAVRVFSFDDGLSFVSGDYSAATDRLSLLATKRILARLLQRVALPIGLRERLEDSLTSSVLDYSRTLETFRGKIPDALYESIRVPEKVQQTNGQLMGNILSFPILCLVNLASYLLALTRYDGSHPDILNDRKIVEQGLERGWLTPFELDRFRVLINGDDILFKADIPLYQSWRRTIVEFGLELSVGKNYFSERFFTVNSELYTAEGFTRRPWWGGLLTDILRMRNELKWYTGVDVLTGDLRQILPKIQSHFLLSISPEHKSVASDIWLENYAPMMEAYSGLNWFLPVEMGGMGLMAGDRKYTVTFAQKKLAIRLSYSTGNVPRGFAPQGTLLSAENEVRLMASLNRASMAGEVLRTPDGRKYVLDKHAPMAIRSFRGRSRVYYRAHELVTSVVQATSLFSRWLDYHVDGVRVDVDRVKDTVRRMLVWGMALSSKKLELWDGLDVRPRYLCVRASTLITPGQVEYASG
jgi:hypothetical protein